MIERRLYHVVACLVSVLASLRSAVESHSRGAVKALLR